MNSFIKYYIDSELVALKNLITDSAPETLDTLNELAAALNDDPAFFSSMSSANTTLQTNIDNLSASAADARDALQTALQSAIDAVNTSRCRSAETLMVMQLLANFSPGFYCASAVQCSTGLSAICYCC